MRNANGESFTTANTLLVLHEVLAAGEVRTDDLSSIVLEVDLAAVDAALGVLGVDAGLARLVGARRRSSRRHAGLGEMKPSFTALALTPGVGARLRADAPVASTPTVATLSVASAARARTPRLLRCFIEQFPP